MKEQLCEYLIRRFGQVGPIPVDIFAWIRACSGDRGGGASGHQVKVVAPATRSAASFKGLPESKFLGVFNDVMVGGGVVSKGNDGGRVAPAELNEG